MTVHLVVGDDEVLVSQATRDLVHQLVGDADASLLVEDHSPDPDDDDPDSSPVADAARTLPFLTDRRIVVVRNVEAYKAAGLRPLVAYLEDPSPSTELVLACQGRPLKALRDAVTATGGEVHDVGAPRTKKASDAWFADHLRAAPVQLAPAAVAAVREHLGEDLGRLEGLLGALSAAHGPGAQVGVDDVAPYLGEAGGVPRWALGDALDSGRTGEALAVLQRLLSPAGAGLHPLQVLATLQGHYGRMLRLDGAPVTGEKDAAAALGIKGSTYPAKKALAGARRLGHDGVAQAIALLARADLDLKGKSGLDGRTVLEVLVARLSRLGRRR